MATHSSILARRIPWTEEPGGGYSHGVTKSWTGLSDVLSPASQADSLPSETPGEPCTELPCVSYPPPTRCHGAAPARLHLPGAKQML